MTLCSLTLSDMSVLLCGLTGLMTLLWYVGPTRVKDCKHMQFGLIIDNVMRGQRPPGTWDVSQTYCAEVVAFALGGFSSMPAVQNFSICAALAVFLDFGLQVCNGNVLGAFSACFKQL